MILMCLLAVLAASLVSAGRLPGAEERIVNGRHWFIEEAPYQVAILKYDVQVCGGAIYSERIILTAAHCLNGTNAEPFSVRAGSSFPNFGGQVVAVQEAYPHEGFKPSFEKPLMSNDIGVLYLKHPLKLNTPRTKSIELTEKNPATGSKCLVTGWGVTYEGSKFGSIVLRGAILKIANYSDCERTYTKKNITEDMICALEPGRDSCKRDSGGPLVSLPDVKLIGIVSWGKGCGKPHYPGVYASVYHLRDWIENTIKKIEKNQIHN